MKIHILTDNRTKKRGLRAEHGLSIYIEHKEDNILFDTGQSDVYIHNALNMGLNLSKANHIILSHGHYDHCSGLIHFPQKQPFPKVYVHKSAFVKRYALNSDGKSLREVGIPWLPKDYSFLRDNIIFTQKSFQINPDTSLYGEIPSAVSFENVPEGFFIEEGANKIVDMIKDEQMLIIDTDKGLCIFIGCSHPGVVNCLNYALKHFPRRKIHTLIAGMHMENITALHLQMTIQTLIDLDIQRVVPLHCTGIFAICEMKRFLKDRCFPLCAGDSLEL